MDITQIIVAIIGAVVTVAGTIITSVVVPWIKSRTSETQQAVLSAAAKTAVLFAQQTMASANGTEKLEAAIKTVTSYFANYNMTVSTDVLVAEIESALKALKLESGGDWA